MKYFLAIIISVLTVILLLSCQPPQSDFQPEWDRNHSTLIITINLYQTEDEMIKALEARLQRSVSPNQLGMAIMSPDDNVCEIYSTKPRRVDDKRTMTLGHEFLHCVYGRYHKE
jgi:hypothetical protein